MSARSAALRRTFVRHLVRAVAVLVAVSLLVFAATELAPGDAFGEVRLDGQMSTDAIAALRHAEGLDRSFLVRYGQWVRSAAKGDFGRSVVYRSPIAPLVAHRALNSLMLVAAALVVTWAIVLPLGVWTAARDRSADGRIVAAGATALVAVPDLLIAIALVIVAARSGVLPTGGMRAVGADQTGVAALLDRLRHSVMPVVALTLIAAPPLVRHVRASMLDALRAPFVVAAAARGIPYQRRLWRSALRAAANPLVSLFGLSFAALFSASMMVEVVMSWPGLGPLLLDAVRARDEQMVLAGVMLATVLLLVGNSCADVLLRSIDPRIST